MRHMSFQNLKLHGSVLDTFLKIIALKEFSFTFDYLLKENIRQVG